MINSIHVENLLSFGNFNLDLDNLNILIGGNGSGKSNLIEVFALLQAAPRDIGDAIRTGGGIQEWLWKGEGSGQGAVIEVIMEPLGQTPANLRYRLHIQQEAARYVIKQESMETETASEGFDRPYIFFNVVEGEGVVNAKTTDESVEQEIQTRPTRRLRRETLTPGQSVLREFRSADIYPEITEIAKRFSEAKLYRNWSLGRKAPPRMPQPSDLPFDFLSEEAENLTLVVNEFENMGLAKLVGDEFRKFFERFSDFSVSIHSGQVQLYMHERDWRTPISATRWSDGMLRYLIMLSILLHPNPPGLVCIDEPEVGLHPDILPHLARLIKSASERTQLIITTHSAELVDQFTDDAAAVVVCERDFDGATRMKRLDAKRLDKWLEDYTLGELWRSGEIGGNPS